MGPVRSLIVIAASSPPRLVTFDLGDRQIEAVIPPTYVSSEIRSRDLEVLSGVLQPAGYDVRRVTLPAKMLAVRVGLAEYGRNGLAYVEGLGSFVRLDVFGTDAPLVDDAEAAAASALLERLPVPPRMRRCLACAWCYHACPTTCIDPGGDRIDPLRCLTYSNEHEGGWPDGLRPDAHNSLVGCMSCQMGCRVNLERGYLLAPVPAARFDWEETAIILEDLPQEKLPEPLRSKLDALDLAEYSPVLGRNLRALAGR
jgi:epoxyqueuosine reductase